MEIYIYLCVIIFIFCIIIKLNKINDDTENFINYDDYKYLHKKPKKKKKKEKKKKKDDINDKINDTILSLINKSKNK